MKSLICILCPRGCHLNVDENTYKVSGNQCPRGAKYAPAELTNPVRVVTSTVAIKSEEYKVCPVKTSDAVPKAKIVEVLKIINNLQFSLPIKRGEILLENIADTGVNLLATKTLPPRYL